MRRSPPPDVERGRIRTGLYATTSDYGMLGAFKVRTPQGVRLRVLVSNRLGWEHVSVTDETGARTPSWDEMAFVKELFWRDDEAVMQLHPPKAEHINCHPHCLHLWRPVGVEIPLPPGIMVGPKEAA